MPLAPAGIRADAEDALAGKRERGDGPGEAAIAPVARAAAVPSAPRGGEATGRGRGQAGREGRGRRGEGVGRLADDAHGLGRARRRVLEDEVGPDDAAVVVDLE